MTLDNLNSRLYYVDQHIIVSDNPMLGCPVMWCRHPNMNMEKATKVLKRIGFRMNGDICTDDDGNEYYPLEENNGKG